MSNEPKLPIGWRKLAPHTLVKKDDRFWCPERNRWCSAQLFAGFLTEVRLTGLRRVFIRRLLVVAYCSAIAWALWYKLKHAYAPLASRLVDAIAGYGWD